MVILEEGGREQQDLRNEGIVSPTHWKRGEGRRGGRREQGRGLPVKVAEAAVSSERKLELAKTATSSNVWWPEAKRASQEMKLADRTRIFWSAC